MLIAAVLNSAVAQTPIVDGDGDGVDDNVDLCLYTPPTARVDAQGCSARLDQDNDGVGDDADDCPYSPAGAQVDARGCAVDDDFDGIANGVDACSATELGAVVDARGCARGQIAKAITAAPKAASTVIVPPPPPAVAPTPTLILPVIAEPLTVEPAAALEPPTAPLPAPELVATPVESPPAVVAPPQAPLPAASIPAPAPTSAPLAVISVNPSAFYSVSFPAESNSIGAGGLAKLRQALPAMREALKRSRHSALLVEAYADIDSDGPNPSTVARSRANKLRRLLEQEGIDPKRLRSVGHAAREAGAELRRAEVVLELD